MAPISENLASAIQHHRAGRLQAAEQIYRQILQDEPNQAAAIHFLGVIAHQVGKHGVAVEYIGRAIKLKGNVAALHNNLGVAFKDQGKLDEALACFRSALELKPDYAAAHSNLLYTQVFCPGYDPQTLYEEHRRWNRQHAEPLGKFIEPHPNDRSPQRRLRIGYLSPDFRRHPVGRFLLPLLESHDRGEF